MSVTTEIDPIAIQLSNVCIWCLQNQYHNSDISSICIRFFQTAYKFSVCNWASYESTEMSFCKIIYNTFDTCQVQLHRKLF